MQHHLDSRWRVHWLGLRVVGASIAKFGPVRSPCVKLTSAAPLRLCKDMVGSVVQEGHASTRSYGLHIPKPELRAYAGGEDPKGLEQGNEAPGVSSSVVVSLVLPHKLLPNYWKDLIDYLS